MRIAIVSPEAVPYAKTGGLADVAGALFEELAQAGHFVSLFLPFYPSISREFAPEPALSGQKLFMGERGYYFNVLTLGNAFFIENPYFFSRGGLYGDEKGDYPDNPERFAFFCRAVLQAVNSLQLAPDIYHVNDWQTALLPFYKREAQGNQDPAKSVLTIHNIGYQGICPRTALARMGIPEQFFSLDAFEFFGKINILKGGIVSADAVTTVSPTYAREILHPSFGFGLEGILKMKGVTGILNGLDYRAWDPARDPFLSRRFDIDSLGGKRQCRQSFSSEAGFRDPALPLVGIIGRLVSQKGYDFVAQSIDDILDLGVNVAVLGTGDRQIEAQLRQALARHPGKLYMKSAFSDETAHRIYAGSDMFLMPSRYEPCGLAQMIAMRYGTVPIVRETGGLADTVQDFHTANLDGTGFVFRNADPYDLIQTIKRALCVFANKAQWDRVMRNAMRSRFTWDDSVSRYLSLYESVIAGGADVSEK
ncbi:MAG: glycogen synthase GlgA [Thermodesulfovibrionales bacterium]